MSVRQALSNFVAEYHNHYPQLTEIFDSEWRSPCEQGAPFTPPDTEDDLQHICWQPLARSIESSRDDFAGLEQALECSIHPDIKDYFGSYWSGGLEAAAPDGHVSLILLWNQADRERLIENLIGHALAKRRSKSGFSVFFACTEAESELFLSVDNDSGAVLLEKPGYKPVRQVALNLESFLARLTPASPDLHPERAPGTTTR